jgi:hypothetical protein
LSLLLTGFSERRVELIDQLLSQLS